MSEHDSIQKSSSPANTDSLAADLTTLGLQAGMTVIVHSSLSRLGWVNGGAVAVILALETVLGPSGTLVMPTHSSDLSDPADWQDPPVPEAWWQIIRDTMPAYEPDLTPTRGMGVIPETFRKCQSVRRSTHPQMSFAAWGANAEFVTAHHALNYGLGEGSPLARLYDLDAWVLLLGVGHGNNTSLHLAEYRATWPSKHTVQLGTSMLVDGQPAWVNFPDIGIDTSDFETIGEAFNQSGHVCQGTVGIGSALFFRQRPLVDFAAEWMSTHRK
ncbi:MAG TPA: AAC(3) family N-acetyltransferase [Aggregatilineaceae bacterium]|nr:AAC(3) family N-acetyltransferase [Aggregatilineaceae bacterium]